MPELLIQFRALDLWNQMLAHVILRGLDLGRSHWLQPAILALCDHPLIIGAFAVVVQPVERVLHEFIFGPCNAILVFGIVTIRLNFVTIPEPSIRRIAEAFMLRITVLARFFQ